MNTDSPCYECVHMSCEEIEKGLYAYECEECAPEEVFNSEWGCFRYEERRDLFAED